MDPKQFKDFCDEWKKKGALDFTRKSHYEPMAPLFEAHAEVVEVTVKDFHDLGTENGVTTFYPRKETTDKFGAAAGLSFMSVNIGTRKESPMCLVGKAQCEMLGPDGQMISMAPAEYEYDAEVRAEIEIITNMKKYKEQSKYVGPNAEIEKKLCIANQRKVARRRADTGARTAAIIAAIGMPTGLKNIFQKGPTVYLLFSRIIYNAKNKMVMDRALDSMFGAAKLLAGPQDGVFTEEVDDEELPMRNANEPETTPSARPTPAASVVSDALFDDEFDGVENAFGVPSHIANDHSPRGKVRYVRIKYGNDLNEKGKQILDKYLDDDRTPDTKFEELYAESAKLLSRKGITLLAWSDA